MRWASRRGGRQRRQLGDVERHPASVARTNRFRGASRGARILAGCCGDSTSAGWAATCAVACPGPQAQVEPPIDEVRALLADVRARGDDALRELTERFDGAAIDELRVPDAEREGRARRRSPPTCGPPSRWPTPTSPPTTSTQRHPDAEHHNGGITVRELQRPVDRAGCYVPSDLAPLVSTVLMTAVPGQGRRRARGRAASPRRSPTAPWRPGILAAAAIAGVDEVYRVGGPAVIGALAYGTESIRAGRRDRRARAAPASPRPSARSRRPGLVGVPSALRRARPRSSSWPTRTAPAAFAAIDVVLQAEHGPDGLAWLDHVGRGGGRRGRGRGRRDRAAARPRREHLEATLAEGGYVGRCATAPSRPSPWPTPSRPSTSSCSSRTPTRSLPLVRHAGAVFCGPYAPASVGDYLAGPNHVLPTYGSARFSGALRVDDFLKHIHVVSLGAERPRPRSAAHVEVLATYEGLDAHAESIRLRRRPAVIAPRDDLALMAGYHSPQVDVDVRLNTNEAPEPPPAGVRRRAGRRAGRASSGTATPTARTRALREAIAAHHGVDPAQVFAANGSNEVLQTLCLAYGGPGRTVAVFEPTYALHSHIARITGTGVAVGERTDDLALDLDEVRRVLARGRAGHHVPVLAEQPHRAWSSDEATVREVLDLAPGPARGRRGLRPVRAVVGARAGRRRRAARRHPHLLEDVVDGGRPPRLPRRAARAGRPSSTRWCCRTTSTR